VCSYTKPDETTVFVNLKDSTPASKVPDMWYRVRTRINDIKSILSQGMVGSFKSVENLEKLNLKANNKFYRLADIATIKSGGDCCRRCYSSGAGYHVLRYAIFHVNTLIKTWLHREVLKILNLKCASLVG